MLTETFYVRRMRKDVDPATQEARYSSDEQGEVGAVKFMSLVPVPDPNSASGHRMDAILGVCWEKTNYPAISFESPGEVEHMDQTLRDITERLDDDYGDEFLMEVIHRFYEKHGLQRLLVAVKELAEEVESEDDEDADPAEPEQPTAQ